MSFVFVLRNEQMAESILCLRTAPSGFLSPNNVRLLCHIVFSVLINGAVVNFCLVLSIYRKTSNKRPRHLLEHGPRNPGV